MDYPVKQLAPNHADHITYYKESYLNEMFKNEQVIAQPKYDGERMLIHIDYDGSIYCTSRRFSKKTNRYMENQSRLPILETMLEPIKSLGYTVIDCECYSKDWSTIAGILHSLPERAVELQKANPAKFACFDCLFYNGEDLRDKPYTERLKYLDMLIEKVNDAHFHIVEFMTNSAITKDMTFSLVKCLEQVDNMMNFAICSGFEGIVVKSLNRAYYDKAASLKAKKFETLDVVVCGYQQGRGKYSDTIGALEIGYYDKATDSVIKISKVNCGTDEDRNFWRDNWSKLQNSVIEVKCQEITSKSLRHPVYIRRREDKEYTMCTRDTIFKE